MEGQRWREKAMTTIASSKRAGSCDKKLGAIAEAYLQELGYLDDMKAGIMDHVQFSKLLEGGILAGRRRIFFHTVVFAKDQADL